jgi:hypothetical protein
MCDAVNQDNYFVESGAHVAAMSSAQTRHVPSCDAFDELGHEDQFFGVSRLAKNVKTRLEFYECVLAAVPSAMFSTFKSCLSTVARNSACNTFHLDVRAWIKF